MQPNIKGLADRPSGAIRDALDDLEKCRRMPDTYCIDMDKWHAPVLRNGQPIGRCAVCMSGASMARRLDTLPDEDMHPCDFAPETQHRLRALNHFRAGQVRSGLYAFYQLVGYDPDEAGVPAGAGGACFRVCPQGAGYGGDQMNRIMESVGNAVDDATGIPLPEGGWRFRHTREDRGRASCGWRRIDGAEDRSADIAVRWLGLPAPTAYRISTGEDCRGVGWNTLARIVAGQHGHPMAWFWRLRDREWCVQVGRVAFRVAPGERETFTAHIQRSDGTVQPIGSGWQSRESAMGACGRTLGACCRHTWEV